MKRLMSALLLVATALTLISVRPALAAGLPACSIYEVYSYREAGYVTGINVGNFSAITLTADPQGRTGGQANWVQLGQAEISFIKEINVYSYKTWSWADNTVGTIYLGSGDDYADSTVKWPRIALGSNETGINRNQVCVLEHSADGQRVRIAGIPKSADYAPYLQYKWLFNVAYTVFPTTEGTPNRTGNQALYIMPLWDPAGGFKVPDISNTGLWLPSSFLATKLGEFGGAIGPTPTPSPAVGYRAVVRAGTVVYQRPGGVKVYKLTRDTWFTVINETTRWAQIGDRRWVLRSAIYVPR